MAEALHVETETRAMKEYYKQRTHCEYYSVVKNWLESYKDCDSLLDIGSADTPVATWGDFRYRFSVDPNFNPGFPHVTSIKEKWPECRIYLPEKVSVVTCLQVLEHIEEIQAFVDAIFEIATDRVILSVPYMWPPKNSKTHVQDPVNRKKLRGWAKRKPLRTKLVLDAKGDRLVEEYAP